MDEHKREAASTLEGAEQIARGRQAGARARPFDALDYALRTAQIHAILHLADVVERALVIREER